MSDELTRLDATAQAELVRRGRVKPIELVDAAIHRIEKLNPDLNAVIIPLFEKARAQATSPDLPDGPFKGVPFLLKDLMLQSKGDPYHEGMELLKKLGWRSDHDTYLAQKFRAAGFVFLGKTNVPELGPLPATEPRAYGPTRNPWNTARSTGGSSGGAAAAVASGMVPAAHASDGGGSIRIPASECGIVGLKPSRGRTSLGPDIGEAWAGAVVEHVLTRSVRDTAAILDAVSGPMPGDPNFAPLPVRPFLSEVGADPGKLKIGMLTSAAEKNMTTHVDCVKAVQEAGRILESLGHHVEESFPPPLGSRELRRNISILSSVALARDLDILSDKIGRTITPDDVEPFIWAFAELGRKVTGPGYLKAIQEIHTLTRQVAQWWVEGHDLLLTPTLAEPPPRIGEFTSTAEDPLKVGRRSLPFMTFTAPFNATGQPAVSLPLSWNGDGLPVGVQLVAAYGKEDLLIRLASQLEVAHPWKDRWPPVHA